MCDIIYRYRIIKVQQMEQLTVYHQFGWTYNKELATYKFK